LRRIVIGGLYYVKDEYLTLPPESDRTIHSERRPVVVLSGPETNSSLDWPFVLCCPISGETSRKTQFCVKLSAVEAAGKKCWVRVPAIQPLEKIQLEDHIQTLNEDKLELIRARLLQYLDVIDGDDDVESVVARA
jgi:mRNA-degrading endonuclease toxin of MazEF toxin-antitoxin module